MKKLLLEDDLKRNALEVNLAYLMQIVTERVILCKEPRTF